ncbi:iron ABC transporter ATP-binding protein [Nitrospira sp.]|nr:iron ABC transporter ATP-binding protein [Nitrospira sp.]
MKSDGSSRTGSKHSAVGGADVLHEPGSGRVRLDTPVVLELRQVSCAYDPLRPAVQDISLAVRSGEIVCLLGPSGCGKTTVLRAIAGFEPVTTGDIRLGGRLVSSTDTQVPTEQRSVGMVFQEYALFPHLRVAENIGFGLRGMAEPQRNARITAMLALTGLTGMERRYPHELSGGQQQRVALARALAHNPVILLLDEPFSNLDPDMATHMRQELHSLLKRTNTTTVLVTHDHDEAFAIADRIAVLNHGRLEQLDTPEMIYHLPATPFVADFVGQADFIPGVAQHDKVVTELGEFVHQKSIPAGTSVVVMIRPDDVCISSAGAGDATILARQFRGSENLYRIRLRSGRVVHSSEASTAVYPIGAKVTLSTFVSHTVVFPDARLETQPGAVPTRPTPEQEPAKPHRFPSPPPEG